MSRGCTSRDCGAAALAASVVVMKGLVLVVVALAAGCVEEASEPRSCEPVMSVDGLRQDDGERLEVPHDGASYCLQIDVTTMERPHIEVTAGDGFLVELRDLDNTRFAGLDGTPGSASSSSLVWDPAGGVEYDVLLHIAPEPPTIYGSGTVFVQLTPRP